MDCGLPYKLKVQSVNVHHNDVVLITNRKEYSPVGVAIHKFAKTASSLALDNHVRYWRKIAQRTLIFA